MRLYAINMWPTRHSEMVSEMEDDLLWWPLTGEKQKDEAAAVLFLEIETNNEQ